MAQRLEPATPVRRRGGRGPIVGSMQSRRRYGDPENSHSWPPNTARPRLCAGSTDAFEMGIAIRWMAVNVRPIARQAKPPRCASVRDTRTPERTFAAVRSEPRRTGWAAAWNGKPYPFAAKGRRRLADDAEHTTPDRGAEVFGQPHHPGAAAFVTSAGDKAQRDGGLQAPRNLADADGVEQIRDAAEAATPTCRPPRAGTERAKKAAQGNPTATAAVLATPQPRAAALPVGAPGGGLYKY